MYSEYDNVVYYMPINDTPIELHVFHPTDTEHHIKLKFLDSRVRGCRLVQFLSYFSYQ